MTERGPINHTLDVPKVEGENYLDHFMKLEHLHLHLHHQLFPVASLPTPRSTAATSQWYVWSILVRCEA
jgi:hypothetical protein